MRREGLKISFDTRSEAVPYTAWENAKSSAQKRWYNTVELDETSKSKHLVCSKWHITEQLKIYFLVILQARLHISWIWSVKPWFHQQQYEFHHRLYRGSISAVAQWLAEPMTICTSWGFGPDLLSTARLRTMDICPLGVRLTISLPYR